jgi:hypothetical protein
MGGGPRAAHEERHPHQQRQISSTELAKRKFMKTTSMNTVTALRTFGLILALGAMPLLAGVIGCATDNPYNKSKSTDDRIEDHGTSARVMMALAEDTQYKYSAVNVETLKGTVQLTGFVNSRDQKNRAGEIAEKVTGVKDVVNKIKVKESVN